MNALCRELTFQTPPGLALLRRCFFSFAVRKRWGYVRFLAGSIDEVSRFTASIGRYCICLPSILCLWEDHTTIN